MEHLAVVGVLVSTVPDGFGPGTSALLSPFAIREYKEMLSEILRIPRCLGWMTCLSAGPASVLVLWAASNTGLSHLIAYVI